jgi:hypothetical protein
MRCAAVLRQLDAVPAYAYIQRRIDELVSQREAMDMRLAAIFLTALALVSTLLPSESFATDWARVGEARDQPLYPYPNLPGVKSQADKKDEEQYRCRTETRLLRRRNDEIFRSGGMPTLVYVCDRDGLATVGTKVPLKGHYQPVR